MQVEHRPSLLPHAFALLYGCAIAYASLQPFAPWIVPEGDAAFWLFAPGPHRWTRFDLIANFVAYVPFGVFAALVPRRATPTVRIGIGFASGLALSFLLETLQSYLPPRDANPVDLLANSIGAFAGGLLAGVLVRAERARAWLSRQRRRVFLPGTLGDFGLALLALWLVAQINPGIPLFAVTFEVDAPQRLLRALVGAPPDPADTLIEAAQSALQLLGVGLFVALLLRERRFIGGAVLLLVGAALLIKGLAAWFLLKPSVFVSWLSPGALLGVAAGAFLLLPANLLPRPAQVAICAIGLLSSLLTPLLAPDLMFAAPPLTLYSWRYGHLLNFNGLTRIVLVLWPLAASVWLFVLAGRPAWGHADVVLPPPEPPDPL
jgi:VanZ family protein